jgi:hypothetical protein
MAAVYLGGLMSLKEAKMTEGASFDRLRSFEVHPLVITPIYP